MKINSTYKRFRNSLIVFFFILTLFFFILSTIFIIKAYIQDQNGILINANVVEVNVVNDKYIVKVEYTVENIKYEQTLSYKDEVTVTDLFQIRYDKNDPSKLLNKDYTIIIAITASITIISAGISLEEFFKLIINDIRKKKLIESGIKVSADIIEVYINNKAYKFKGKYPYRIRLEYFNPQDNKKYIFKTENLYEDMKTIIDKKNITKLPVFINSSNTYEYYIDLGEFELEKNYE